MNEKKIYTVKWDNNAIKELAKLDKQIAEHIYNVISKELALNPYKGKRLKRELKGLFSYRYTRSYRIIYDILEEEILVVILQVGHRKNVYD